MLPSKLSTKVYTLVLASLAIAFQASLTSQSNPAEQALASRPSAAPTLPSPTKADKMNADTVSFGHIATTAPKVAIVLEGVKLHVIRSADATDISVNASCPAHWNVSGSVIRQVAFGTTQKGISLRASGSGSVLMVNGKLYPLPQDANGSLHGLSISQKDGQVVINGTVVKPILGSDVPGPCSGLDLLDVVVPESYRGDLMLYANGASDIVVDGWQGGDLICNLSDASAMSCGNLQGLSKAIFELRGQGKVNVKQMSAQVLVADNNGTGALVIESGSAQVSNATVSGTGQITLHGKFKNLKKAVSGGGSIEVLD